MTNRRPLAQLLVLTTAALVFFAGCGADQASDAPRSGAPAEGSASTGAAPADTSYFDAFARVRSVTPSGSHAVLEHGTIEGFMDAMTMPFELLDPALAEEVSAGDSVHFEIRVIDNVVKVVDLTPADEYAPAENSTPRSSDPAEGGAAPSAATKGLGQAIPFELTALDGSTLSLADLAGKVVVLNFWATWCGPCREEIPEFNRLQAEYVDQGVQFVGIALDEEGQSIVEPFAKELAIAYPTLLDDGKVSEAYKGHYVVPTTYLIDRSGTIRLRYIGAVTFETMIPILDELTAG